MKKSYLFLCALLAFSQFSEAQTTISVKAPKYDGVSFGPFGPNSYLNSTNAVSPGAINRGCYLIPKSELMRMALTNSVITGFGFDILRPGGALAAGQFTLYLENTADLTYTKGATFSNIISGMNTYFTGNMTLPTSVAQTATTSVGVNLASSFTYTGNGIYVAFEWAANAAPTSTLSTRYLCQSNPTGTDMGAYASVAFGSPAPPTLTLTSALLANINPQMRFTTTNIATNEAEVMEIKAPGIVSKLVNPGHPVVAIVRNNSINTMNNVTTSLSITGANIYNATSIIPSIPAGGTVAVPFTGFLPTANGIGNMTVSVAVDQFADNDMAVWQQSVNCSDYANSPPLAPGAFNGGGIGYSNQPAIIATPFTPPSSASMTAIKFVADAQVAQGSSICGVLLDNSGGIIAMTNTINAAGGAFNNLKFTPPIDLTGGTLYYYGVAQLVAGTYPFASLDVPATTNLNLYYNVNIAGGGIGGAQNHIGYLGMVAVLGFSNTTIEATASKSLVCKQDGPGTVTLTATGGASSYVWTPGNLQGATVVVTPTVVNANGSIGYNVTGTDGPTNCKSNVVALTVSVQACAALSSNNSEGYDIKLFPNPSVNGKSTITGLVGTNMITVYNTLGQIVLTESVAEESTSIDLSSQPSGNYLVKITSSSSESRTIKIVNQN